MREIKFRAWDTVNKKMYSAEELGQDEMQINPDGRGFFNASNVSPRLSQYYNHLLPLEYIGMRDESGKEIYEGDILEYDTKSGLSKSVVKYQDKLGAFVIGDVNLIFEFKPVKVIGNIYDNPELLSK